LKKKPQSSQRELAEELRKSLPELPDARAKRIASQYGLRLEIAKRLVARKVLADFFEDAAKIYKGDYSRMANYLLNDLLNWLKDEDLRGLYVKVKPEHLAKVMKLLDDGVISIRQAKEMAEHIAKKGVDPEKLVEELGYKRITDESLLRKVVEEVFSEYPKAVRDAIKNPKAINYLVGMVMRKTRGRADPKLARRLVEEKLSQLKE
jgi:aspartyl-tRNA(Asn)/glutamyl-tRNA(Gln) amidotransferase subunit B